MALGPRLDLRQSQSLVMTPQLQQAIRLLALSNLEIEGFIAEEVDKNPLLDSGGGADDEAHAEVAEPDVVLGDGEEPATVDLLVREGDAAADGPLDIDYDSETFHQDSAAEVHPDVRGDAHPPDALDQLHEDGAGLLREAPPDVDPDDVRRDV